MTTNEFIAAVSELSVRNGYRFEWLRGCIPLGKDALGNFAVAHRDENRSRSHHVCVAGEKRRDFICRLLLTLACIYDKGEACFLILSPDTEYAKMLGMGNADFTVPYIRNMQDYTQAIESLRTLIFMRGQDKNYSRLFIVADGLEELPDASKGGFLDAYKVCFNTVGGCPKAEIITGVDLDSSVYRSNPGTFIGIGNCLVRADETGRADVTYVNMDSTLTPPRAIMYPDSPTLEEQLSFFNGITESEGSIIAPIPVTPLPKEKQSPPPQSDPFAVGKNAPDKNGFGYFSEFNVNIGTPNGNMSGNNGNGNNGNNGGSDPNGGYGLF